MSSPAFTVTALIGATALAVGLILAGVEIERTACLAKGGLPVPATHLGVACVERVKP